jgi:hypothetical protein
MMLWIILVLCLHPRFELEHVTVNLVSSWGDPLIEKMMVCMCLNARTQYRLQAIFAERQDY